MDEAVLRRRGQFMPLAYADTLIVEPASQYYTNGEQSPCLQGERMHEKPCVHDAVRLTFSAESQLIDSAMRIMPKDERLNSYDSANYMNC